MILLNRRKSRGHHLANLQKLTRHFQGRLDNTLLLGVAALAVVSIATLIPVVATLLAFAFKGPLVFTPANVGDWSSYASFLTSLFQVIISITTVAAALFATFVISRQIDERKDKDERNMAAIRLSEMMYDKDFYVSVVGPSWEVVTKWLHWEGKDGDDYRLQVVSEFVDVDPLRKFTTPEEAAARRFHNVTRFVPHYTPYPATQAFTELSEHMALNTWLKFWAHVDFLLQEELVTQQAMRELFQGWYRNWYRFMYEYRVAGLHIAEQSGQQPKYLLKQLARLEENLGLSLPPDEQAAAEVRGKEIAMTALFASEAAKKAWGDSA